MPVAEARRGELRLEQPLRTGRFRIPAVLQTYLVLLAGHIVSKGLVFVSTAMATRAIGPAQAGILGACTTIVAYLWVLANCGMDVIGTRQIAGRRERVRDTALEIVPFRLSVATGATILSIIAGFTGLVPIGLILPLGVAVIAYSFRVDWILLSMGMDRAISFAAVAREATYLLLVAIFVVTSRALTSALWAFALAEVVWSILTLLTAGTWLRRSGSQRDPRTWSGRSGLMWAGVPVALMSLMALSYNKIDSLMLVWMRSSHEAGIYLAAYSVVFGASGLAGVFSRSAFAHMVRAGGESPTAALPGGVRVSIYTACCGAAVATLIYAWAGHIMSGVYGPEFAAGAGPLRTLIWCVWAAYAYGVLQQGAIVAGRQGAVAIATVAAVALNIGLNTWLIPREGMQGAAVASVVAECAVLVGVLLTYRRQRGFAVLAAALLSTALAAWLAMAIMGTEIHKVSAGSIVLAAATFITVALGVTLPLTQLVGGGNARARHVGHTT